MYNKLLPNWKGYSETFLNGVPKFVSFALERSNLLNRKNRCSYSQCKNLNFLDFEDVKVHLYRRGFVPSYWYWTCHWEIDLTLCDVYNNFLNSSTHAHTHDDHNQDFDYMIPEADGVNYDEQNEEFPNTNAIFFMIYYMLHTNYYGQDVLITLNYLLLLDYWQLNQRKTCSNDLFNQTLSILKETHFAKNFIPEDYYRTLKLVSKLGLST